MASPNTKLGIRFLVAAAVLYVASIALIMLGMEFLGTAFPVSLGLVLYFSGPLPIIPAIIAAIAVVLLIVGTVQDSWSRKRPPD